MIAFVSDTLNRYRHVGKKKWYKGKVSSYHAESGTYDIAYDDGDKEKNVLPKYVKLRSPPSPPPSRSEEQKDVVEEPKGGDKVEEETSTEANVIADSTSSVKDEKSKKTGDHIEIGALILARYKGLLLY